MEVNGRIPHCTDAKLLLDMNPRLGWCLQVEGAGFDAAGRHLTVANPLNPARTPRCVMSCRYLATSTHLTRANPPNIAPTFVKHVF